MQFLNQLVKDSMILSLTTRGIIKLKSPGEYETEDN